MISSRLIVTGALAVLAVSVAACSGTGGPPPLNPAARGSRQILPAAGVKITEFTDLPQGSSNDYSPSGIASGPQGSLWVTDTIDQDYGENAVVQIATSGETVNTFYYQGVATEGSSLLDLVEGPDGNLWMTDFYNEQILRMTPTGSFKRFSVSGAPLAITVGSDKALWFTEYSTIGRITTKGKLTLYTVGSDNAYITTGPDGALWFTEFSGNAIGRITTHGKFTQYTKGISSGAGPFSIAAGPDGALWFTEALGGRVGRMTTTGKVTEYSRGITPGEDPSGIAAGPDGALWFTEYETYDSYEIRDSMVGRITTHGKIAQYSKGLTSEAEPNQIVAGPDRNMWFVESRIDRTGRATL